MILASKSVYQSFSFQGKVSIATTFAINHTLHKRCVSLVLKRANKKVKIIVTLGPQLATAREEKSSMTPQAGGQLCKGEHLSSSSISIAIGCTTASRVYNKVSGKYPHWFHSPANDNGFYTYKTHRWKDYLSAKRAYPWPLGCSRRRL